MYNYFKKSKLLLTVFLLLLILHVGSGIGQGFVKATADTTDPVVKLMDLLDLSKPGTEDIAACVKDGRYDNAMHIYTLYLLNKLRKADMGLFGWHDTVGTDAAIGNAAIMTGKLTEDEYKKLFGTAPTWNDPSNINGTDGQPIDWIPENDNGSMYSDFSQFARLASAYWKTGEEIYLQKWFQVTSDFCLNQKRQIEMKKGTAYFNNHRVQWNTGAQTALSQAGRVANILKSLAVFAKNLPGGGNKAVWGNVLKPVETEVTEEAIGVIPEKQLADIILSLINDHPKALLDRYISAGAVPNQRFAGLSALVMTSRIFPEFEGVKGIQEQADIGMADYAKGMYYEDGAQMEQSFNYNIASNDEAKRMLMTYGDDSEKPAWFDLLQKRTDMFDKMMAALSSPLGGLPGLASYMPPNTPAVWNDKKALTKLQSSIRTDTGKNAFTSIAFPYAGYYIMRSGWDIINDIYLSFIGSARARGHMSPNTNTIEVVAYGRKLLTYGGIPWYDKTFAPASQIKEYEQLNSYFSATYKNNTVIVNGMSQDITNKDNTIIQTAREQTYPARWLSSVSYDYAEGVWDGGYRNASGKKITGVDHSRQVIYIRNAGLWIINDTMINSSNVKNTYSQMWGFTPKVVALKAEGFTNEQVMIDEKNNCIMTRDPSGPNIWLYNFSPDAFEYKKYYGSKEPPQYLGWFASSFSGEKYPKVDVHVNWSDEKPMLTAIIPTRDANSPVVMKKDLSEGDISGFEMTMSDGMIITYLAAANGSRLKAGEISAEAKSLLVSKSADGKMSGIVLGCTSMQKSGKTIKTKFEDFQFELSGNRLKNVIQATVPAKFEWENTENGLKPVYTAAAEKNINKSLIIYGMLIFAVFILSFSAMFFIRRTGRMNLKDL